ncbi:hypothetical protein ACLOJK_008729 [Asimina triloba]
MAMAQLAAPVCTDALSFPRSFSACSRSPRRTFAGASPSAGGRPRKIRTKAKADGSFAREAVADDYYSVLGLCASTVMLAFLIAQGDARSNGGRPAGCRANCHHDGCSRCLRLPDATPAQIKKAYYNCMKSCHPDLSGNDPETNNFCMFINGVYGVLSDPIQRMIYDEIHGYALTAINPFVDDTSPKDHAFVDEFSCIGCKNCANVCPDVFQIEEDFGRARVQCQSGDPSLVQQAIDSCLRVNEIMEFKLCSALVAGLGFS